MSNARARQSFRARCVRPNSRTAYRPARLRRANRPHCAVDVDFASRRPGTSRCARQRHTGNPRTGGHRMTQVKHIHIIGIGGSAMAPLAGMLREQGFHVTGSDSGVYPPGSTLLDSLGISYFPSFEAAHLTPAPDLVIVANIIARGNPELEETLERKIPYRSMPEILEEVFLPGKHSVVVSGTYGKTTSTAMLSWIIYSAGKQLTFLVGGVDAHLGKSYGLGQGTEMILVGY